MKLIVTDSAKFEGNVFGGWAFLKHFPQITTTGIKLVKHGEFWYITDDGVSPIEGSFAQSTLFFTEDEVNGSSGCTLIGE